MKQTSKKVNDLFSAEDQTNQLLQKLNYEKAMNSKQIKEMNVKQLLAELLLYKRFEKEIWSIEDVALFLQLQKSYIYKLTSQRMIPHRKPLSKTVFFIKDEILDWVKSKPKLFRGQIH